MVFLCNKCSLIYLFIFLIAIAQFKETAHKCKAWYSLIFHIIRTIYSVFLSHVSKSFIQLQLAK